LFLSYAAWVLRLQVSSMISFLRRRGQVFSRISLSSKRRSKRKSL